MAKGKPSLPVEDDGRDTAALLEAIASDPADATPYLVLADALLARGDPRGELIALQHARTHTPTPALATAEQQLLKAHRVRILGGRLARALDAVDGSAMTVTWRFGFLQRVAMAVDDDAAKLCEALLASPAARVLESLDLLVTISNQARMNRLLDAIATRCPTSLRELRIASGFCEIVALRAAWPHLRRLRALRLGQWGGIDLGAFDLPALEDLELIGPKRGDVASVLRHPPPNLRRLHLDLFPRDAMALAAPLLARPLPSLRDVGIVATDEELDLATMELGGIRSLALQPITSRTLATLLGAGEPLERLHLHFAPDVRRDAIHPILDGALPHLRELHLGPIDGRPLLDELLASRILPTLQVVDLPGLDDDDLARLVDEAPRFAHLAQLRIVTPPTISAPLLAQLRSAVPQLVVVESRLVRAVDDFRDA